jgi:hypothetical protein
VLGELLDGLGVSERGNEATPIPDFQLRPSKVACNEAT